MKPELDYDRDTNTVHLSLLATTTELDYDDVMILQEALDEVARDMEAREHELDIEAEQELRDTEQYLERLWRQ